MAGVALAGREVSAELLERIRSEVRLRPEKSRTQLARQVCECASGSTGEVGTDSSRWGVAASLCPDSRSAESLSYPHRRDRFRKGGRPVRSMNRGQVGSNARSVNSVS